MSEGRMEQDINRPMGACALVGHGKQVAKSRNKAYRSLFHLGSNPCMVMSLLVVTERPKYPTKGILMS